MFYKNLENLKGTSKTQKPRRETDRDKNGVYIEVNEHFVDGAQRRAWSSRGSLKSECQAGRISHAGIPFFTAFQIK